ncbi:MAG: hypothetical protein H7067_01315 [Burkholderiales bacterium]|nr:hypothetical protein [Opitutaceae bacterium]
MPSPSYLSFRWLKSRRPLLLVTVLAVTLGPVAAKDYSFVDKAAWSEAFTTKNPEGTTDVKDDGVGGAVVFTAPRFAGVIHLLGREGVRPATVASATEVDFRVEGTGSLGIYVRGKVDASDSYAILVRSTALGYGELQVYRAPIWPVANFSTLQPLAVQKIDRISGAAWYRLKIRITDQVDSVSLSATLVELAPIQSAERFIEGVAVTTLDVTDTMNPLIWPGLVGLRLYVHNETMPPTSVIHLRRISLTPDPAAL